MRYVYRPTSESNQRFWKTLDEEFSLLREFRPHPVMRWDFYTSIEDFEDLAAVNPFGVAPTVAGPIIRIYRVPKPDDPGRPSRAGMARHTSQFLMGVRVNAIAPDTSKWRW